MPDSVIRFHPPLAKNRLRWPTLFLLLTGFPLAIATTSAQGVVQENQAAPATAAQQSAQRPRRVASAKRDPADQAFRLAAMAESTRTIAISLTTNLHLAFDTLLLRTHTAWTGPSLGLFGPPYNGVKTPFLATAEGTTLWTMPPISPWSATPPSADAAQPLPSNTKFKGLSTKAGVITLIYELGLPGGNTVQIYEQARPFGTAEPIGMVRRFEIGPSTEELWFVAHAEMNATAKSARGGAAVMIHRTNDVLLALVRSSTPTSWSIVAGPGSFEEALNADEKGESVVRKRSVTGPQTRVVLKIPAHTQQVAVEVLSAAVQNSASAESFASAFTRERPAATDMAFLIGKERPSTAPKPAVFSGDKSGMLRESGDEYFRIEHFPLPKEINLQVTGMDWLSKDELVICTWSGEIHVVEHAPGPVEAATYRRFARGLNEPLGLKVHHNHLYAVQKPELTRITDTDRNGEADLFESVNADWGYSGNYHAFAFGPLVDKQNNFYAFLCGQHGRWDVPYVGWCVQVSPDGKKLSGFCSGLRAPNGVGFYGPENDLFMADNQGNWIGACKLNHLRHEQFYGFPSGTPAPESDYKKPKPFAPPAIWFPRRWSPSTSGFVTIEDDRFGPFKGQMLVGDFQNAVVLRVFLEKVDGEWQGAVWPFAKGFHSGVNRLSMGPDGKLYVGGLKNAAWAASAPKEHSLDRVSFTGKAPFEIKEVHVARDGFDLVFTQPLDPKSAGNLDNYDVRQFTYLYHETYGSPEIDHDGKKDSSTSITVKKAEVSTDRLKVRLTLEGSRTGYVSWVRCLDILNSEGNPLWHDTFYYTLNRIPAN